jgi:nucleoid-associated protein YgaU
MKGNASMKLRTSSRIKGIFLPAIAALLLGMSAISCSSTGDGEAVDPEATEETATNNGDPLSNSENGAAAEGGEQVAEGGNSGELNNLVNEGSAEAAAPAGDAAVTNESAGADPFANQAANPAATAEAAPTTNGTDPFAPANGAATAEAAPADSAPLTEPTGNVVAQEESVAPAPEATQNTASVASAAGEYVPENGTKMPYYIQKGDTLASIAQKIYGSSGQWKTLAEQNNVLNPNKIYPGSALYYTLSDKSRPFADRYERASKGSHTVAAGETLSSISEKVLGSEHSWRTLWKMNPSIKNPDMLKVGQVIYFSQEGAVAIKNESINDEDAIAQVDIAE